jgi:acyl-CoA synthetase (AMP-forming)/AMP-acid ligase II
MTESAAVGTRGFNTSKHKKYASVGLLAPNMHARIVHVETGCSLPPGSCGELWLHGPAIMKGNLISLKLLCHFGTNWVPFFFDGHRWGENPHLNKSINNNGVKS